MRGGLISVLLIVLILLKSDVLDAVPEGDKNLLARRKESIFLSSIYVNDISLVELFIQDGGDVNVINDEGFTALHIAAMHSYHTIVMKLLAAGANVHELTLHHGMSALILAAIRGHLSTIHSLVAAGADASYDSPSGSAIQFAAQGQHWEAVTALLDAGGGKELLGGYSSIYQWSVEQKHHELTEILLNKDLVEVNCRLGNGETLLVHAVQRNDARLLQLLIARGGDVSAANTLGGVTPLQVAAMHGFVDLLHILIGAGAAVNAVDVRDVTALRWAVLRNHTAAAAVLLSANATIHVSPESQVTRNTLLWIAAMDYVDLARVFLQLSSEVDVNARALSDGVTALHVAVRYSHHHMAEVLLTSGASPDVLDSDGLSPYHYALRYGDDALVGLLQLHSSHHRHHSSNYGAPRFYAHQCTR